MEILKYRHPKPSNISGVVSIFLNAFYANISSFKQFFLNSGTMKVYFLMKYFLHDSTCIGNFTKIFLQP